MRDRYLNIDRAQIMALGKERGTNEPVHNISDLRFPREKKKGKGEKG